MSRGAPLRAGQSSSSTPAQNRTAEAAISDSASQSTFAGPPNSGDGRPAGQTSTTALGTSPRVLQGEPDVYYLRNKAGELVPMLDWEYEDFRGLWEEKRASLGGKLPPPYTIEALTLSGRQAGDRLEISVDLDIRTHRSQWVQIPLMLKELILQDEPDSVKYSGSGEFVLSVDGAGSGYVGFLRGGQNQTHHISLQFKSEISQLANEKRVQWTLPSSLRSQLELEIAGSDQAATLINGGGSVTERELTDDRTLIVADRLSGLVQLAWSDRQRDGPPEKLLWAAEGAIVIRIERQDVWAECMLHVYSFHSSVTEFELRIPREWRLVSENESMQYRLSAAEGESNDGTETYLVSTMNTQTESVNLSLTLHRLLPDGEQSTFDIAPLEVVGAARQHGFMAIVKSARGEFRTHPLRDIRRVPPKSLSELPESWRGNLLTGDEIYEYSSKDAELQLEASQAAEKTQVQARYAVEIGREEAILTADLNYDRESSGEEEIELVTNGWQIVSAEPGEVHADDDPANEKVRIVMSDTGADTPNTAVRVTGRKNLSKTDRRVEFQFPRPQKLSLLPDEAAITSQPGIQLIPRDDEIQGMRRLGSEQSSPILSAVPRVLLYECDPNSARFVAIREQRQPALTWASRTRVILETPKVTRVTQSITIQASHEPVDLLEIETANYERPLTNWTVRHDGELVRPLRISPTMPNNRFEPSRHHLIELTEPFLGTSELDVSFEIHSETAGALEQNELTIPLCILTRGEMLENRVSFVAPSGVSISPDDPRWNVETPVGGSEDVTLELHTDSNENAREVSYSVLSSDRDTPEYWAEKIWLQTMLTDGRRQDRFVIALRTDADHLVLYLPPGSVPRAISIKSGITSKKDAVSVSDTWLPAQRILRIPLEKDFEARTHIIEVDYHASPANQGRGNITLEPPRLDDMVWVGRMYWQVLYPSRRHLILSPPGYVHNYQIAWDGYLFSRKPVLDQFELEQWIDAQRRSYMAIAPNAYLFSSFGNLKTLRLWTAGQSTILLVASSVALCVGLLLLYGSPRRHPTFLFLAALMLLVGGLIAPDDTMLFAQAGLVGFVLAILAKWLHAKRSRVEMRPSALSPGSTWNANLSGREQLAAQTSAELSMPLVSHSASSSRIDG